MTPKAFDRKFGPEFFASVPKCPGVYLIYDDSEKLIYVGKAADLRRRLGAYRRAGARKKERKMRRILRQASSIKIRPCDSHIDACLLEARLIQTERPKLNISGAFSFMYPFIGTQHLTGELALCCASAEPPKDFTLFGAYRSRWLVRGAFFALVRLLRMVGYYIAQPKRSGEKYVVRARFRRIPQSLSILMPKFLRGENREFLTELTMALLDSSSARRQAAEVEEALAVLEEFYHQEAVPLARAIARTNYPLYPVPQSERDPLFIAARMADESAGSGVTIPAGLWYGHKQDVELD